MIQPTVPDTNEWKNIYIYASISASAEVYTDLCKLEAYEKQLILNYPMLKFWQLRN